MSLGLLSAASRICDDVNLLWSIAEVYNESTQKAEGPRAAGRRARALDKDRSRHKESAVQPPPVWRMWMRTTTRRSSRARLPNKPTTRPHHRPGWTPDKGARFGAGSALFPAYQRVAWRTSRRCGLDQMVGIVPYGLARIARIVHNGQPGCASDPGGRGPPFERAAIKLLQGRVLPVEPYRGWRVSILPRRGGRRCSRSVCAAAARLEPGCVLGSMTAPVPRRGARRRGAPPSRGRAAELPRDAASAFAARLVRRALFGGSPARRGRDRRFRGACGARWPVAAGGGAAAGSDADVR